MPTVLLASDDPRTIGVVADVLRAFDYRVETSAVRPLDGLPAASPDGVVLDLPADAAAAAAMLTEWQHVLERHGVPLLALLPDASASALPPGVAAIKKPFRISDLLGGVRKL